MERIIIVGGGIAGVSSALNARKQNQENEIILIEKEKHAGYLRGNLPYIISDNIRNYYDMVPTVDYLIKNRINVHLSSFVKKIDLNNKKIIFLGPEKHERVLNFTKIIIATGTMPIKLNVKGRELNNIFELKTIEDAIRIKENIMKNRKVVIIGGGLVALETSEVLLKKGCKVVIVSPEKEVLYKIFDENFGQIIREKIEKSEIEVITENKVKEFYGKGKVEAIETEKGIIPCDYLILALGVKPNTDLAKEAGIPLGKYEGIIVNEEMKTKKEDVYAAGDCVEYTNFITNEKTLIQTTTLALQGGEIAGKNAAGGNEKIGKIISNICAKIFGSEIASIGITCREAKNFKKEILVIDTVFNKDEAYIKLIFDRENKKLIGAQLICKRAATWGNFLALAIIKEVKIDEIAYFCNSYSPFLGEPIAPIVMVAKKIMDSIG
ncbi:MAG: FAD-dependent oxidoreductase [Nitrososphaeria archaeon]|nr:FAD-dependent oxidoreductase [Nitrososphaeria archaeon]